MFAYVSSQVYVYICKTEDANDFVLAFQEILIGDAALQCRLSVF